MSTLVIIDLDGVIADSAERFNRATVNGKIDWNVAFDPALVQLDVPVPGALETFKAWCRQEQTMVVFLTSRPVAMRTVTVHWLDEHGFQLPSTPLYMKPPDKQYTKTVVWKAEEVCEMAKYYTHTIFIDDEQANRDAVQRLCPGVEVRASL